MPQQHVGTDEGQNAVVITIYRARDPVCETVKNTKNSELLTVVHYLKPLVARAFCRTVLETVDWSEGIRIGSIWSTRCRTPRTPQLLR